MKWKSACLVLTDIEFEGRRIMFDFLKDYSKRWRQMQAEWSANLEQPVLEFILALPTIGGSIIWEITRTKGKENKAGPYANRGNVLAKLSSPEQTVSSVCCD